MSSAGDKGMEIPIRGIGGMVIAKCWSWWGPVGCWARGPLRAFQVAKITRHEGSVRSRRFGRTFLTKLGELVSIALNG